jgi:transcriptional regulator with XRE-family HTH domain
VSALTNFIRHRIKELDKSQAEVAALAGIRESSLSYILSKTDPRPTPRVIKGLGRALEVHPSVLTSLMGYPVEPIPDVDDRLYEFARQLLGAPWLADRLTDLLRLPQDEFDDLMEWLDFQKSRSGESGNRSKP